MEIGGRRIKARTLSIALAAPVTLVAYVIGLGITGFAACGISGCGGGGFGPAYSPTAAQVTLVTTGLTLVPLAVLVLWNRRPVHRVIGAVLTLVLGAILAMALLGINPSGCTTGTVRTADGGFTPGSPTCVRA